MFSSLFSFYNVPSILVYLWLFQLGNVAWVSLIVTFYTESSGQCQMDILHTGN